MMLHFVNGNSGCRGTKAGIAGTEELLDCTEQEGRGSCGSRKATGKAGENQITPPSQQSHIGTSSLLDVLMCG
jgi:hypothetical protein